ncbi:MAG: hypothetical protein R3E96_02710 [Planctomycetota bacterium]
MLWFVSGGQRIALQVVDLDLIQDLALLHLQAELTLDAPLPLLKGELLGVERVAIAGGTVLGERVRETTLLTGAVSVPPLMRVAQAQGMTAKGLAGSPVLNHRGQIIGLLTSRIYEASGTRLVASGAAIGMLQVGALLQLGQAGHSTLDRVPGIARGPSLDPRAGRHRRPAGGTWRRSPRETRASEEPVRPAVVRS